MIYFEEVNKQLLNTLSSSTFAGMTDEEIDETLAMLMFRAVADFRFPRIQLTYAEDVSGYYFENDITQKEINVLLALMKKFWLEQQLDAEKNFEMLYYDKDVRTFSRGNIVQQLKDRYKQAKEDAKYAQFDYGRVNSTGGATMGEVNDAE